MIAMPPGTPRASPPSGTAPADLPVAGRLLHVQDARPHHQPRQLNLRLQPHDARNITTTGMRALRIGLEGGRVRTSSHQFENDFADNVSDVRHSVRGLARYGRRAVLRRALRQHVQ
ncbi:hypothetical protein ACRAWD_30010 [Caulobacter segnis]